jgi:carbamoyltransferase
MTVLGFSVGHDKGAVIVQDNRVAIGISQERLSRLKHDGAFTEGAIPVESIMYCLTELDITIDEIDLIVYSTTELLDNTYEQFNKIFKIPKNKLKFIPHHLAHAYSSFFTSGFDEAAVIVADASGSIANDRTKLKEWYPELTTEGLEDGEDWTEGISIYHLNRKDYKEVYKKWIKYPVPLGTGEDVSVGTMYSEGCHRLIYSPDTNSWPAGKLMGLASYADPEIVEKAGKFIQYENNELYIPNNPIYPRVTWKSDFFSKACVAGIYQREQERVSLYLADMAKNLTNSKNVCTAGGSFLNCNSNELILKSDLFENCYFVPPADDSGIPLGCAWWGFQQVTEITYTPTMWPYFGKTYSDVEILDATSRFDNIDVQYYNNFDEILEIIGEWLTQNRVVGWFQNGSEIGPRALGNRSILASPINRWMKDHINHDIKKREWYRPFAPAVIFDKQKEIFDTDYFSPFMLVTAIVNENWREKIPAVVHVDNSARYQSVTPVSNPRFFGLINKFYEKTGVPVLLNTSFNGPHEPIVETPYDAIKTFLSQHLDFLVVGNYIITNQNR